MIDYETLFLISIFAWTFSNVLIMPQNILSIWGDWLEAAPWWIAKPLGECALCFGGQIAFWYYFAYLKAPFLEAVFCAVFVAFIIDTFTFLRDTLRR